MQVSFSFDTEAIDPETAALVVEVMQRLLPFDASGSTAGFETPEPPATTEKPKRAQRKRRAEPLVAPDPVPAPTATVIASSAVQSPVIPAAQVSAQSTFTTPSAEQVTLAFTKFANTAGLVTAQAALKAAGVQRVGDLTGAALTTFYHTTLKEHHG